MIKITETTFIKTTDEILESLSEDNPLISCEVCSIIHHDGNNVWFVGERWDDGCMDIYICKSCINKINKLLYTFIDR